MASTSTRQATGRRCRCTSPCGAKRRASLRSCSKRAPGRSATPHAGPFRFHFWSVAACRTPKKRSSAGRWSGDKAGNDVAVDVGEAEVATGVAVGQLRVVEAEQAQDRGVQVVDVDRILHRLEAELVGGAVDLAALDAPAGHPHCKAVVVVVT